MRVLIFGLAVTALISMVAPFASAQQADDEATAHQIADNLKSSGQMKGYKVGVAFRQGTAWLNGRVSNPEQAAQAEQVARSTPGVTQVVNNLTVEKSAAQPAKKQNRLLAALSSMRGKTTASQRPAVKPAIHQVVPSAKQYATQVANNEYQGQVATPFYAPPAPPVGRGQVQGHIQQTAAAQPQQRQPQQFQRTARRTNMPRAHARAAGYGQPIPSHVPGGHPARPATHDHPNMPGYAWPSYAAHPNYAGLTYPKQYSPTAWPFIGPFYPYPQVPLGWRKVTLEWDDGWWMLDFKEH